MYNQKRDNKEREDEMLMIGMRAAVDCRYFVLILVSFHSNYPGRHSTAISKQRRSKILTCISWWRDLSIGNFGLSFIHFQDPRSECMGSKSIIICITYFKQWQSPKKILKNDLKCVRNVWKRLECYQRNTKGGGLTVVEDYGIAAIGRRLSR